MSERGAGEGDAARGSGWARWLLGLVILPPAGASWLSLTEAGQHALALGSWSWLVPLSLDASAAYAAALALRDVEDGDSAAMNRLLVWAYVAGSAALNWWWARQHGGLPAAIFFAAMSVSASLLWDRTLRRIRRGVLRARGAVSPPSPRFRLARWVVAFSETGRAWRYAVVESVVDPAEAVRAVRQVHAPAVEVAPDGPSQTDAASGRDVIEPVAAVAELEPAAPVLVTRSKASVIREVAEAVRGTVADSELPRAVAREAARLGVEVDVTYVHDVFRRDEQTAERSRSSVAPLRRARA